MPNPFGVPEVTVQEVAEMTASGKSFIIMDVREQHEVDAVSINADNVVVVPLSQISQKREAAIPASLQEKGTMIIAMCHHGMRSAQAAAWMMSEGWTNVKNMAGGIHAYALEVDPSIGTY